MNQENGQEEQKAVLASEAQAGRMFPAEFVDSLADNAYSTIYAWLKAHQAPIEALDLLDSVITLREVSQGIKEGSLPDALAADLPGQVAQVTGLIAFLGGSFYGPEGEYEPQGPRFTWPGLSSAE